jgi:signal transduction histidine kinase
MIFLAAAVLAAGCTGSTGQAPPKTSPVATITTPAAQVSAGTISSPTGNITTTQGLVTFVGKAAGYARVNGMEKAVAAFSDTNGSFVSGNVHVFAIDYNGTLLADPEEPGTVGTNISDMTDSYGTPLVKNLAETARYGRGYVSYTYPNPAKNGTSEPRITVVEDVDGTYYVAAGMSASEGVVFPSTVLNTSGREPAVSDLVRYVKDAVAYAKASGKENALAAFNDPKGSFVQGELVMMAFDYNGTNLASPPYSPELSTYHINLINYQDPDGVTTIRGMRDLSREGGGFLYTVAKVKADGKDVYVPKIDYAEPVDDRYWIFSGIVVPEYTRVATGNLTGIQVRNHTRPELYERVNRAVAYARTNGKEKTYTAINDPQGPFVTGDLFVWAESSGGILLADPFWKAEIGHNELNYTDRHGMKTTQAGISAMKNGSGFSRALFPDTARNGTFEIPKLIYMKQVDDTWWIGSGIYGVEME